MRYLLFQRRSLTSGAQTELEAGDELASFSDGGGPTPEGMDLAVESGFKLESKWSREAPLGVREVVTPRGVGMPR